MNNTIKKAPSIPPSLTAQTRENCKMNRQSSNTSPPWMGYIHSIVKTVSQRVSCNMVLSDGKPFACNTRKIPVNVDVCMCISCGNIKLMMLWTLRTAVILWTSLLEWEKCGDAYSRASVEMIPFVAVLLVCVVGVLTILCVCVCVCKPIHTIQTIATQPATDLNNSQSLLLSTILIRMQHFSIHHSALLCLPSAFPLFVLFLHSSLYTMISHFYFQLTFVVDDVIVQCSYLFVIETICCRDYFNSFDVCTLQYIVKIELVKKLQLIYMRQKKNRKIMCKTNAIWIRDE